MKTDPAHRRRRAIINGIAFTVCLLLAALAIFPLLSLVSTVIERGLPMITWEFLSQPLRQKPDILHGTVIYTGGIYHGLLGTGMVVGLALLIGGPVGILSGIWLAEFATGRPAAIVRGAADSLAGVPSIVAGLFGYAVVVVWLGYQPSAIAAATALSLLLVPTVTRTTEEALRTVPQHLRDASLALGAPKWRTTLQVVMPNAWGGVATGLLLSTARIAGETAPVLFTALTSFYVPTGVTAPVATLPKLIYDNGASAESVLREHGQGAALVLMTLVLGVNLLVRLLSRPRSRPGPVTPSHAWSSLVANLLAPGTGTLGAKRMSGVVQLTTLGVGVFLFAAGSTGIAMWFLGAAWLWALGTSVGLVRGAASHRPAPGTY